MLGVVVLLFLAGLVSLFIMVMNQAFESEYKRLLAIEVGMTEEEVVRRLGTPHWIFNRKTAPQHYYVAGWSYKERPITNKVLIYSFGEPIAYYYLDESNKVEDIFIGGS